MARAHLKNVRYVIKLRLHKNAKLQKNYFWFEFLFILFIFFADLLQNLKLFEFLKI